MTTSRTSPDEAFRTYLFSYSHDGARRPLVASRAAILASLLPADAIEPRGGGEE